MASMRSLNMNVQYTFGDIDIINVTWYESEISKIQYVDSPKVHILSDDNTAKWFRGEATRIVELSTKNKQGEQLQIRYTRGSVKIWEYMIKCLDLDFDVVYTENNKVIFIENIETNERVVYDSSLAVIKECQYYKMCEKAYNICFPNERVLSEREFKGLKQKILSKSNEMWDNKEFKEHREVEEKYRKTHEQSVKVLRSDLLIEYTITLGDGYTYIATDELLREFNVENPIASKGYLVQDEMLSKELVLVTICATQRPIVHIVGYEKLDNMRGTYCNIASVDSYIPHKAPVVYRNAIVNIIDSNDDIKRAIIKHYGRGYLEAFM